MKYFLGILAAVVIVGGIYIATRSPKVDEGYATQQKVEENLSLTQNVTDVSSNTQANTNDSGSKPTTAKTYTMADVAAHNTVASCYSAINGFVYDLTTWIGRHPGGQQEILAICGKDGSSAFTGKHGGDIRPEQILAGFKIGELAK